MHPVKREPRDTTRWEPSTWEPIRELEAMNARLSRWFGGFTPWTSGTERETLTMTDFAPACDITETDKEYKICAELPGMKKDDVHITLEKGVLVISGERNEVKEDKTAKFHRKELSYGSFMRSFSMPDNIDETKVDASFKDGMLNVVIPKIKAKEQKTKEITVH